MIARITSDKVTLPEADKPTAIKVDDADVDAELLRLKDHAVTAEALQSPRRKITSEYSFTSRRRGTTHYYTIRACNCTACVFWTHSSSGPQYGFEATRTICADSCDITTIE
jgi:hypothetical protein